MRLVFSIFFALLILFFAIFLLTPLSALSRDFVSYSLAATCNYVITSTLILFKALLSNRSQMTSKCGKNISDTLGCASCATFLFLPHFDVICDLLLNRRTATWNLFVKYTQVYIYIRETAQTTVWLGAVLKTESEFSL